MRRREFIMLLGGAAAWPLAARAQQPAMPVVGWLNTRSERDSAFAVAAVRRGLGETGYVDGQNVTIEYRWLEHDLDRLPSAMAELVDSRVMVIAVIGSSIAALAAKAATNTIPVVFATGGDPVKDGLVSSLNRPDGNLTGVSFFTVALGAKRLELLHDLVSNVAAIAMLVNPDSPDLDSQVRDAQAAARTIGTHLHVLNVRTGSEVDAAFVTIARLTAGGLLVGTDPFFTTQRHRLAGLAARHRIPAIYSLREYTEAGGLMSYGASVTDAFRQLGVYVGRILAGAKPADLPVMLPTKFELVINVRTAKALGLEIPDKLLALADEVIE
jgi:putative ABC transport system substrate-binding protein